MVQGRPTLMRWFKRIDSKAERNDYYHKDSFLIRTKKAKMFTYYLAIVISVQPTSCVDFARLFPSTLEEEQVSRQAIAFRVIQPIMKHIQHLDRFTAQILTI